MCAVRDVSMVDCLADRLRRGLRRTRDGDGRETETDEGRRGFRLVCDENSTSFFSYLKPNDLRSNFPPFKIGITKRLMKKMKTLIDGMARKTI